MKKLEPAIISENEIHETAMGWLELWRKGDPNTINLVDSKSKSIIDDEHDAYSVLYNYVLECTSGEVWMNDKYQVARNEHGVLIHLSIKRLDKSPLERDWRDYQAIKNQLIGKECEAIELFPAESRLVDNANQFHLWGWGNPEIRVPVGWNDRMVSDNPIAKSQQRPFEQTGEGE